ncbi:anti-sigma factor family protein, partial [Mycobacterium sp.]|uniref:anti-sigma factor family protein n=1 Tax=Mycobacterium sp. TaxID=1785 RepID=UPI002B61E4E1|nr:hypothetical protein [Mycobacterium sp.]
MTSDSEHVDLAGLLSGELPPAERTVTVGHIRGCDHCRDQLAETAALVGELRDAGRHRPVDPSEVPPLDLAAIEASAPLPIPPVIEPITVGSSDKGEPGTSTAPTGSSISRRLALAVAAAVIVALAGGIAIGHTYQSSRPPPTEVRL